MFWQSSLCETSFNPSVPNKSFLTYTVKFTCSDASAVQGVIASGQGL